MSFGEGIATGAFVVTTLGLFLRITNNEIDKRKRIYERIDEIKKDNETKLQSKEICTIVHTELKDDIKDIKKKTECIPDIKAGLDLLLKKNGLKNE